MLSSNLHDLESERRDRAELDGKTYAPIIDGEFRWDRWAAKDGCSDHNAALTGDDLVDLRGSPAFSPISHVSTTAPPGGHHRPKTGEVFTELRLEISGRAISYRDMLEIADGWPSKTSADRHELSSLYETRIRRMGNAGRNGGEYLHARPLIRAMIRIGKPQIGEDDL